MEWKTVKVQGKSVRLNFYDTPACDFYDEITECYLRSMNAAVVCFDYTAETTFEKAKYWVYVLKNKEEDCVVYLCGTKYDLIEKNEARRKVPPGVIREFLHETNIQYIETSAVTGYNVDYLFTKIVEDYVGVSSEVRTESEHYLRQALKSGFVNVVMFLCILLGLPGVGKTHLKFLLLNKQPPCIRTSTNCAEAPVRIEIKATTGTRLQTNGGKWKKVGDAGMFDIVAEMILIAESNLDIPPINQESIAESNLDIPPINQESIGGEKTPKQTVNIFARIVSWMKQHSSKSTMASRIQGASARAVSPNVSSACQKAMSVIWEKVIQSMMKLRAQGLSGITSFMSSNLCLKWVYFTDSGGQPQYHELLPLFMRRITCAMCVIRLPDKLDQIQDVEYFKEGKRIGSVQKSQFTAKDTVQCLVNTIQSYSAQDQPPKIIMIGTHLDLLEELEHKSKIDIDAHGAAATQPSRQDPLLQFETLEEKNRQLLEMLEPDFSDQLVYYSESSTPKKLLFPVNTLNPEEHEESVAQTLRGAVEASGVKEIQIPIWWYIMEQLLRELTKELGRGVLSRAECLDMAQLLNIKEEAFSAALVYFDEINVIKYSPDILPEVVFIDSQILFDKVSELVCHSYLLKEPTCNPAEHNPIPLSDEELRHFRDQGVISREVLAKFSRHYVSEIFSVDDLIIYLKQLLVFAPIPKPVTTQQAKQQQPTAHDNEEETHFLVPALLQTLMKDELEKHRFSSSVAATLLVRFPRGFRRAGVFCCFVVHLIKHCGWDLIFDSKEPLYRNCIRMRLLTSLPISVVLIDSDSYIEIHVNTATGIPVSEYEGLLPIIKQAILSGIFAACKALNYQQTKPELTFYCPHTQPSLETTETDETPKPKQHTATLTPNRKYWRCDLDPDAYFGPLEQQQSIWFGIPRVEKLLVSHRGTGQTKVSVRTPKLAALSTPSSKNLTLIEWRNEQGERKMFRLKLLICHQWKELGCLIEIPLPVIQCWERKYREDPVDSINAVLSHWLENPTDYYPISWEGLDRLLNHAELGQVAEELKHVLKLAS